MIEDNAHKLCIEVFKVTTEDYQNVMETFHKDNVTVKDLMKAIKLYKEIDLFFRSGQANMFLGFAKYDGMYLYRLMKKNFGDVDIKHQETRLRRYIDAEAIAV